MSDAEITSSFNLYKNEMTAQHGVRTGVLKVRRIPHEQHVGAGRVRDTDEAGLVLQRRRDANAGGVGVRGAVVVRATHPRPRHHLTHRHTGVLRPRDHREGDR